MKIYRAVFEYNNADSCEWERWYSEKSPWYIDKSLAEQHPQLREFKDYISKHYRGDSRFKCRDIEIEEKEIEEKYEPLKLEFLDEPFLGTTYIDYTGPHTITKKELCFQYYIGSPFNDIRLSIGEERFKIEFNGEKIKVSAINELGSKFYEYSQEVQDELIEICQVFSLQHLYHHYLNYLTKKHEIEVLDIETVERYRKIDILEVETVVNLVEDPGFVLNTYKIDKRELSNRIKNRELINKISKIFDSKVD